MQGPAHTPRCADPAHNKRCAGPAHTSRCAVVDLGSNSVRLVVYEGRERNPVAIFNEKAVLRLGRGLQTTGRLNEQGVEQAMRVMSRYAAVAAAMQASPFEVLATAAVRDASNGEAFVAGLRQRMPNATIRILSGEEEAELSAAGVLCGIPEADGILADIGGGSLEMVRLDASGVHHAATLRLGVIRLSERSDGDLVRARAIAEADLATLPWLSEGTDRDLYLVGGAWRALARVHMHETQYPLGVVHHYAIDRESARNLTAMILEPKRTAMGAPRRRTEDLPYAATVLRRLLRVTAANRVVFSANGIREGWFMQQVPPETRRLDPLLAAARDMAARMGRDARLPPALIAWTAPLFPNETTETLRLRHAACWMSDIGSHDHPEYRAEEAFTRVLRQPGVGLSHQTRAFLALAVALRYEADIQAPFLNPARALLTPAVTARAATLGAALRLAYVLSAGTPELLAEAVLRLEGPRLLLRLAGAGVFEGEGVQRRLEHLADTIGVTAGLE
jgi:exopolyphosphatase/guanosine-5'-triphosphate,3'-diphosphate pyrophosphatase